MVSTRNIPQTQPLNERMVQNSEGGYSYEVGDWDKLRRFLILGTYGGTYYTSEQKLTKQNHDVLLKLMKADAPRVINMIVEVSHKALAPKNDFAIFALAAVAAHGIPEAKRLAYEALPKVCRIATHLFQFLEDSKALGKGRGNGFNRAVARWYQNRKLEKLAEQMVKYRSRNAWNHRDVLRVVRPKACSASENALFHWAVRGSWLETEGVEKPRVIQGFEQAKKSTSAKEAALLVREYGLVREALPTEHLNSREVWEALLENMPPVALMRNLGNMSKAGLFSDWENTSKAVAILTDGEKLRANRVHPMQALIAQFQYSQGCGLRGSNSWDVNSKIVDALDDAFYAAMGTVEPTGLRILVGIDESGSMGAHAGNTNMSCSQAAGAMALVQYITEPNCHVMAFDTHFRALEMSKKMTVKAAMGLARGGGGTDLALPVRYALDKEIVLDAFVIYTDSETWAGHRHLDSLYDEYRKKVNANVKMLVASMESNVYTVGDPNDPSVLQVVGLDASVPQVIASFLKPTAPATASTEK